MKILITGSQGFVGSYLCTEFLNSGYEVVGVDNFSKYGKVSRKHDSHPNFFLYVTNVLDREFQFLVEKEKPDYIIANAAMIGGISYFHKYAYDLLATNERILAATFDAAIRGWKEGWLKRIIVMSSSMVYESTTVYPSTEESLKTTPPPMSTYGFQKLASEYFAKGAHEQYGLPYTIVRPFNCVGVGEEKSEKDPEYKSGNVTLMMSHVLPDLINKCMNNQKPIHILGKGNQVRCYTNGKDLARGIKIIVESEKAVNEDFNMSTSESTTVLELAELVWKQFFPNEEFKYTSDIPFIYDVQKRIPDVAKAFNVLGFEAKITLDESINEVINYMKETHEK